MQIWVKMLNYLWNRIIFILMCAYKMGMNTKTVHMHLCVINFIKKRNSQNCSFLHLDIWDVWIMLTKSNRFCRAKLAPTSTNNPDVFCFFSMLICILTRIHMLLANIYMYMYCIMLCVKLCICCSQHHHCRRHDLTLHFDGMPFDKLRWDEMKWSVQCDIHIYTYKSKLKL